jgi:hypothetical protein
MLKVKQKHYPLFSTVLGSRGVEFGIATGNGLHGLGVGVLVPGESRIVSSTRRLFSSGHNPKVMPGNWYWVSFQGG